MLSRLSTAAAVAYLSLSAAFAVSSSTAAADDQDTGERSELICLTDPASPINSEFFLVRAVIDTSRGTTKSFDQLRTHVTAEYCQAALGWDESMLTRETNGSFPEDLDDSFACLRDVNSDLGIHYLVRLTRDRSRGIVTSMLAMNEFLEYRHCANWLR